MFRDHAIVFVTGIALLVAGLIGCMKRKETLTVAPDGGVKMQIEYEADSHDELYGGDAMPSAESGWKTELAVETDKDGKETYKLGTEAIFAPGAALPDTFAAATDPHAELSARFPTTVRREERPDGIYYHFHRVYPRRDWAQVETFRKALLADKAEAISEKDASEVTHQERVSLVKALADAATVNTGTYARAAFLDVTPDSSQDGWLRAETSLAKLVESLDYERLATLMESPDKAQSDQALAIEAAALERNALDGVVSALRDSGYSDRQLAAFLDRFEWHKRYYDVTGDLGDDAFEIVVEMPGEIVGTDRTAGHNGNEVRWAFNGEWFRDRDYELMATSRVAK